MDQSSSPPSHTEGELAELWESIQHDGVQYPVLLDASGNVIDGNKRKEICEQLGVECPTKKLINVNQETAERLRRGLNAGRRGGQTTLDWLLTVADLIPPYEEEAREAGRQRMTEGARKGGLGSLGSTRAKASKPPVSHRAEADLAKKISADLGRRVGTSTVRRAKLAANLPLEKQQEIREGKTNVSREVWPSRKRQSGKVANKLSARKQGADKLPELGDEARIRFNHDRSLYQSMMNAPVGSLNLPALHRMEKIQELLTDLGVLDPKVAVTQIPPNRCREFIQAGAEWWADFTELCEQRRQAETPDLEPWVRKSSIRSDVLGDTIPVAERHLSPLQKAALEIWRQSDEALTWEQVGVRTKDRSRGGTAKGLMKAGYLYPAGKIGKRIAYKAREPSNP